MFLYCWWLLTLKAQLNTNCEALCAVTSAFTPEAHRCMEHACIWEVRQGPSKRGCKPLLMLKGAQESFAVP